MRTDADEAVVALPIPTLALEEAVTTATYFTIDELLAGFASRRWLDSLDVDDLIDVHLDAERHNRSLLAQLECAYGREVDRLDGEHLTLLEIRDRAYELL